MNAFDLNHEKISPTAKLVAYWRQFSDIPFSKEVASLFKVEDVYKAMFNDVKVSDYYDEVLVSLLEIRYKSILQKLKKESMTQVLEFASGISLRGLAMTADPNMIYVETDLPGLTEEKRKLIQIIMTKYEIKNRNNLFFYDTNILNYNEIEPALKHFKPNKPLAIVHEGLFQYLTKEEKAQAAKNIRKILQQFGGVWLTPDLDTKQELKIHEDRVRPFIDTLKKNTGRNFETNAFENQDEVASFFNELGFNVTSGPQFSNDIIVSSCKNAQLSKETIEVLKNLRLWVLTLRS